MSKLKRTKLLKPYQEDGSTTFPARNLPGVYLIYRVRIIGEPLLVYVGFSASDVYKAMYRHFQTWNDKQVKRGERGERITYAPAGSYRVRVIYTPTKAQAAKLEEALILKLKPRDNPDKLIGYTLTEPLRQLARESEAADFTSNLEAPF